MKRKHPAIVDTHEPDPYRPSVGLLVKLGSMIVHYQEMQSSKGHAFDRAALETLEQDAEVVEWFAQMNERALLPVKR